MDKTLKPDADKSEPSKKSQHSEKPLDPLVTGGDDPLTDPATQPFIKGELDPDDAIHRSNKIIPDTDHETDFDDLMHR
jgi:hypothetical protein